MEPKGIRRMTEVDNKQPGKVVVDGGIGDAVVLKGGNSGTNLWNKAPFPNHVHGRAAEETLSSRCCAP